MIYTKAVREYCLQNEDIVFDISKEYKEHFSMMPYKTFCKILSRLEEEGVLVRESHGAYLTSKHKKTKLNQVVDYYTNGRHGIVVGYSFYNQIGITDYKDKKIEIYTNLIDSKTKKISHHQLIKMDLTIFTKEYKSIIYCLELIEKSYKIIDCDLVKLKRFVQIYLEDYQDAYLTDILKVHKYQYSTICTLSRYLKDKNINSRCLRIFEEIDNINQK